jgi:hypothetical protein
MSCHHQKPHSHLSEEPEAKVVEEETSCYHNDHFLMYSDLVDAKG